MRMLRPAILLGLAAVFAACSSPASSTPASAVPSASSGPLASSAPSATPAISASPSASADSAVEAQRLYVGALTALRSAGSAHLDVTFSGTFDAKGLGLGPVDISKMRFAADLDLANRTATSRLTAPILMDLTFDTIIVGQNEYARASIGGNVWTRQAANGSLGLTLATLADASTAKGLDAAIAEGRVTLAAGPAGTLNGVTTQQLLVTIKVPATADLEGFLLGALGTGTGTSAPGRPWPSAATSTDLAITFDLGRDDLRPLAFSARLSLGQTDATLNGVFSKFGEPLSIKAPKGAVDAPNPLDPPR